MSISKNGIEDKILKNSEDLTNEELLGYLLSFAFDEEQKENALSLLSKKLFTHEGNETSLFQMTNVTKEQRAFLSALFTALKNFPSQNEAQITLQSHKTAGDFFISLVGNSAEERLYIAYLNEYNQVIKSEKLKGGDFGTVFIDVKTITDRCFSYNAKKVVLAHNHTTHIMNCSMEDFYATEKLYSYLLREGIILMEHFVINRKKSFGILKELSNTDNWKKKLPTI